MNEGIQGGEPDIPGGIARRVSLTPSDSVNAARSWWDGDASTYLAQHGDFLAEQLVWGPEGLTETEAGLLGRDLVGQTILELGSGAAQGSTWLRQRGASSIALDVSMAMLNSAGDPNLPRVHASADALPFIDGCFDSVVSAHGAIAFVADLPATLCGVARVLRPGGTLAFSVTHPIRWAFPDDPGSDGLTVTQSYFDRRAYAEFDTEGRPSYVEHHRTLQDTVIAITGAGLVIEQLVEPEWPVDLNRTWGAWSQLRGELIPGTAIWVCRKPASGSRTTSSG